MTVIVSNNMFSISLGRSVEVNLTFILCTGCGFSSSQHDSAYPGAIQYVTSALFSNRHLDFVYLATK